MSKFFKKAQSNAPKLFKEKNPVFEKFALDLFELARRSESLDAKKFLSHLKELHTPSSVFSPSGKLHQEKNTDIIENRLK